MQLSPHFYLEELTHSDTAVRKGIDNTPNPVIVQNLFKVAAVLEQARKILGDKPILVSSGYRCPELNAAIGGAHNSEHTVGMAADFRCPSFGSPLQICQKLATSGLKFGQLIQEGTWVHISAPDGVKDGQVLTAVFGEHGTTYREGLA